MTENVKKEIVFHGIPASPGIAIGMVMLIGSHAHSFQAPQDSSIEQGSDADAEIKRFNEAIDKTREEIKELQKRVQSKLDEREASIFDAHLLIVDDKMLMSEVEDMVRNKNSNAEFCFFKIIERYVSALSAMPDQYIRERASDIEDVATRILSNLRGTKRPVLDHLPGQRIIVAKDLTPSDTALLDRENVQAFAIETGSKTSHTAILARSMQIPAVVGLKNIYDRLQNGDLIIIDGFIGTVIINPKEETQNIYALKESKEEKYFADLLKESRLRPETVDGFCIQLAANIDKFEDVAQAKRFGAAGVGLFRSEYLYVNSTTLPSEDKLYGIFRQVAEGLEGQPAVIRTLDVGGDKLPDNIAIHMESNPFLGLRAVRLCLRKKRDILKTQLRAILRAALHGNISIMFPMITCVDEIGELREFLEGVKDELAFEKIPFKREVEVGVMIETPSAALLAEQIAGKVDFFSIGTNDLVQYTLAVDRGNENVAYLYQPTHPAILILIDKIVRAARKNRIWVSVCGEMAGDPRYTPLLAGLGVQELSMSPGSIGPIRRIIRRLKLFEAEDLVQKALKCSTSDEALHLSEEFLNRIAPDIVSMSIRGA